MSERRRFNRAERVALYLAADGRCEECGAELEPGWHSDHEQPRSKGGPTDLINGQALCPDCNLKKGSQVRYEDTFDPRPFQREVIEKVLDGMKLGRDVTVVLASPGSGKTLAYQATATYLFREGLIDYAAVFVPRLNLARQCETSWMWRSDEGTLHGDHELFDPRSRLGRIRHTPNNPPLIPPGQHGVGFVTTYSALVTSPVLYESWVRANKGRFLLVGDEAQFCGAADEKGVGTKAGAVIEQLHEHAAHTLLLSGTPYRSDGQKLVLAEYEETDETGLQQLVTHAEATYSDGIAEGYLRRFEATLHDARVRWKEIRTNTVREYDLSGDGADLAQILRRSDVWQPIADTVVTAVREKQRIYPPYRGLISCMEQSDAKRVFDYLTRKHPGLRVELAITDDGQAISERALRAFRVEPRDILVTVRKAFIGYDCPEITVVGVLTNYRDRGHLMQLAGRGLRAPKGLPWREQSCRIIAPDDPDMQEFVAYLQGRLEDGLRERERREQTPREDWGSDGEQDPLGYVESAMITDVRAVSNDIELEPEELLLIDEAKHHLGLVDDATALQQFLDLMGKGATAQPPTEPPSAAPRPTSAPLTEKEEVEQVNRQVRDAITSYLAMRGVYPGNPNYSGSATAVTVEVNKRAHVSAKQVRTLDQANSRLHAIQKLREDAAEFTL
jgi:superfamily II DNA or RNA helicase